MDASQPHGGSEQPRGGAGSNERFYADLSGFSDFGQVVDLTGYRPVPDDWVVLISDVTGSTAAIADGRYKDVNMLGAATITAITNACGEADIPYTFGGDGGVVVVPPGAGRRAGSALARLAAHAPRTFGLHLRAGAVAVAELRRRGADLLVRKYSLSPGNSLAMFAGTGLDLADALLKGAEGSLESLAAPDDDPPDLAGLSCRWEPLTAQSGVMLSAIVRANGRTDAERSAILARVLAAFAEIVGERPHGQSPASDAALRFRWPPRGLLREARASSGGRAVAARYAYLLMESLAQGVAQVLRVRIGAFDGGRYRQELRANTDFRKFDGHLRMVLDVTPEQADALAGYLEGEYRGGSLVHGLHRADAALMTCLVFSIEQSEHVHFIDGANGGYAMAARDFKQRAGRGASQG